MVRQKISLFITLGFIVCLMALSCRKQGKETNQTYKYWVLLNINFDNRQITIFEDEDSISLKDFKIQDSIINNGKSRTIKNFKEYHAFITANQKDSIYKWTKELINQPFIPTKFCTDYHGKLNLEIKITYQVRQECTYSSICEWATMNRQTKKIDSLFKDILSDKY